MTVSLYPIYPFTCSLGTRGSADGVGLSFYDDHLVVDCLCIDCIRRLVSDVDVHGVGWSGMGRVLPFAAMCCRP